MSKTIITFGTYDLLHVGHVKILQRAAKLGEYLVVGVSSDELNFSKKAKYPVFSQHDRMEIVRAIKGVDEVFLEESLELKKEYIKQHKADLLVMGDDWLGKFDWVADVCEVKYLSRTPDVSTTKIKGEIKGYL
jgi:glycerol-3-phosphate cytidylyltransferase